MIMSMMNLPDDMFRLDLLPYLTVDDIVKLDNAYMNHEYRHQLLEKISGVILPGDKDQYMNASLFKWLGMRRIYLMSMRRIYLMSMMMSISNGSDTIKSDKRINHC
jgi:hypothetical protein